MSEPQHSSLEKLLEASPAAFAQLADAMPNLVWVADAGGTMIFANRAMLAYGGLAGQEALAARVHELVHPEEVSALEERWRSCIAAGEAFEAEFRLRSPADQAYRWFLTRAVPVRDKSGAVVSWLASSTDIDAQKRATENLDFVIEASDVFAGAQTVQQVCTEFARLGVQRFADWCFVVLTDSENRFKVAALAHRDSERVRYIEKYLDRYPVGADGTLEPMLRAGEPLLFARITQEQLQSAARDEEHLALMRELGLYSAIVAGMVHGDDLFGGIIVYSAESRRQFSRNDADVLQMLAERASARIATMHQLTREQQERRRLQFIGRATEAAYESFDLTTAFGNLARVVVSEIGEMAAIFRVENGNAARVAGAAHRDPSCDDVVRSFVGIRVLHGEAEKRFVQMLQSRKPLVGTNMEAEKFAKNVWPYLSQEIGALGLNSLVTVPLHSRGKVHGALIVYYTQGGRSFKPEDVETLAEIGRHASVALENADVFERERRMSETLQDSLLPPSLPRVEGLSFDAVYLPSATEAQVGGDWYDAFELEDGSIVVTAGDVTGRGADAAVIMGKVRNLLAIAPSYERDPARILDTVESVLARRYPDVIVTAVLGFIDRDRKRFVYANAGHPAPLLRTAHGVRELHCEGLPIGLRREAEPSRSCTADLRSARMLVLYTDGLTEAGHDVIGGLRKLRDVLSRDAVLHTHRPARFIEEACLGNAAADDVAVMAISFDPGIRWSFDAENAKAAQDARGEFVAYLQRQAGDAAEIQTAELVFGELVGNVVRHAPGAIDIDVEWSNGSPLLHVLDRGPAFAPPSHLPDDPLSESGRGLYIVRRLSTSLRVEHLPGYGNHVCAELPLRRVHE